MEQQEMLKMEEAEMAQGEMAKAEEAERRLSAGAQSEMDASLKSAFSQHPEASGDEAWPADSVQQLRAAAAAAKESGDGTPTTPTKADYPAAPRLAAP